MNQRIGVLGLLFFLGVFQVSWSTDSYYSSLKDLKTLVEFEDSIIKSVQTYIEQEVAQLKKIERFLKNASHPIDAKSTKISFEVISDLIENNLDMFENRQDIYEIGVETFKKQQFQEAIPWFTFLLNISNESGADVLSEFQYLNTLHTLHQSLYKVGEIDEALNVIDIMSDKVTTSEMFDEVMSYRYHYENNIFQDLNYDESNANIQKLCNGHYSQDLQMSKNLKCKYSTRGLPQYTFQPFKQEQIFISPNISIYHDFLSDKEIDWFLKFGQDNTLGLSTIHSQGGSYSFNSEIRTSKVMWVDQLEFNQTREIDRRIRDLMYPVGKNLELELMQIANYGIGGHYTRHLDSVKTLNDVEKGGSTVFTDIGIGIKPKKVSICKISQSYVL
ncbi:Prolyl 4-hydroxylase subunit alpha-2 [Nymphon striatum]|nr:Prolyl 4-hydroxylase subunit alpha-2 [Nymphon striatum]